MDIRTIISDEMTRIAHEQARPLAPLTDDLVLLDSGLDSLGFAILVARLEDEVGFDPFSMGDSLLFPTTFGDFVSFYADAKP